MLEDMQHSQPHIKLYHDDVFLVWGDRAVRRF